MLSCCSRSASSSRALTLVRNTSASAGSTSSPGAFSTRRIFRKGITVISRQGAMRRSSSCTSPAESARPCVACQRRNSKRLTSIPDSSCSERQVSAPPGWRSKPNENRQNGDEDLDSALGNGDLERKVVDAFMPAIRHNESVTEKNTEHAIRRDRVGLGHDDHARRQHLV